MTQSGHWSRAQQIDDALSNLALPDRIAALIISIVDQEPRAMDAVAAHRLPREQRTGITSV